MLRLYNRFGRPKHVGQKSTKSHMGKKLSKAEKAEIEEDNALSKKWATRFEAEYSTKILGALMNWLKNSSTLVP